MNYKISGAIRRTRKYYIIFAILWVFISIVLVMPLTIGFHEAQIQHNISKGFEVIIDSIQHLGKSFGILSSQKIWGDYLKNVGLFTIFYAILMTIGLIRSAPKNEYTDMEHGSSDWSRNGEQYTILNNKKGIVLAEDNYLPVDKRGNVNVLVVGGSGSGKSASYSIPNAYQLLGSYVFTDPKGELYDRTAGYLKQHGYEIKVLNLVKPQYSDGYNPLKHISSEIDVDVIANTIVKGQKTDGKGAGRIGRQEGSGRRNSKERQGGRYGAHRLHGCGCDDRCACGQQGLRAAQGRHDENARAAFRSANADGDAAARQKGAKKAGTQEIHAGSPGGYHHASRSAGAGCARHGAG